MPSSVGSGVWFLIAVQATLLVRVQTAIHVAATRFQGHNAAVLLTMHPFRGLALNRQALPWHCTLFSTLLPRLQPRRVPSYPPLQILVTTDVPMAVPVLSPCRLQHHWGIAHVLHKTCARQFLCLLTMLFLF